MEIKLDCEKLKEEVRENKPFNKLQFLNGQPVPQTRTACLDQCGYLFIYLFYCLCHAHTQVSSTHGFVRHCQCNVFERCKQFLVYNTITV